MGVNHVNSPKGSTRRKSQKRSKGKSQSSPHKRIQGVFSSKQVKAALQTARLRSMRSATVVSGSYRIIRYQNGVASGSVLRFDAPANVTYTGFSVVFGLPLLNKVIGVQIQAEGNAIQTYLISTSAAFNQATLTFPEAWNIDRIDFLSSSKIPGGYTNNDLTVHTHQVVSVNDNQFFLDEFCGVSNNDPYCFTGSPSGSVWNLAVPSNSPESSQEEPQGVPL